MSNYDKWWARNHPHAWWREERGGDPLPTRDRLLVAQKVREAYEAGQKDVKCDYCDSTEGITHVCEKHANVLEGG